MNNPYYCLNCDHKYKEESGDDSEIDIKKYSRFLGFCSSKCFFTPPADITDEMMILADEKGDILKQRHKFYHEELPTFHKNNKPFTV